MQDNPETDPQLPNSGAGESTQAANASSSQADAISPMTPVQTPEGESALPDESSISGESTGSEDAATNSA